MKRIHQGMAIGGLLAATATLSACLSSPVTHEAFRVGQKTVGAAQANAQGSLRFMIVDDSAAQAKPGYRVAYIQNTEWNKAKFILDKVDGSISPAQEIEVDATVTLTTLIRSATANFTALTPGSGYRARVELYKTDAGGTPRKIAEGMNDGVAGAGFSINGGGNEININIALTEDLGKVEIPFPTAGGAVTTAGLAASTETNSAYAVQRVAGVDSMVAETAFSTAAANWLATGMTGASGMEMTSTGDLYVAASNRIIKLAAAGTNPVHIAGTGTAGYNGPGAAAYANDDTATNNQINDARGVAIKGDFLYFCDRANHLVREVNLTTGLIRNLAGRAATVQAPDATPRLGNTVTLSSPTGVVVDSAGNLFVTESGANRIIKITPDGMVTAFVTDGLASPDAIEIDRAGNRLWVACGTTVYAITNIDATPSSPTTVGAIPTPTGANGIPLASIGGLAYDYNQTLYVATNGNNNGQQGSVDGHTTGGNTYSKYNGDYNNFVFRVQVNTAGTLRTGFNMERIAGRTNVYTGYRTTYNSSFPALNYGANGSVATTSNANALNVATSGSVTDGLIIDMRNSNDPNTLSGYLYKTNTNPHPSYNASQVLKLSPNAP